MSLNSASHARNHVLMLILLLAQGLHSPYALGTKQHQATPTLPGKTEEVIEEAGSQPVDVQEDLVVRLLQVLGLEGRKGRGVRHTSPPQYMLDLYKAVAGAGGLTRTPNPYHANVVRSYEDRDASHNFRFFFNVCTNTSKKDRILEAEFHVFKLKPRQRHRDKIKQLKSQLLEVKVFQVMPESKKGKKRGHRLLDSRRLSVQSTGWEVFYVREALDDWIRDNSTNLGLLVSVKTLGKESVPAGLVRFAKRRHHFVNRHPLLVLFIDDGRHASRKYYPRSEYHNYGFQDWSAQENTTYAKPNSHQNKGQVPRTFAKSHQRYSPSSSRAQRAVGHSIKDGSNQRQSCTRHDLYVDFEKIGWSAWIISPKGYNAYYCKGDCTFPLGQNQWPTNHATVQSIVHELNLTPGVGTPCCVPNKLYSISLLYFDEHENVILKQYDDMVASSCGCH